MYKGGENVPDDNLLEMFINRDEAAIEQARTRFGARLFATAMNILGSREDAEEIVSDALLKAWETVHTVLPTALGAYLAKMSRNMALNKWKAGRTVKRGGGEVTMLLGELEDTIPDKTGPEQQYEAHRLSAGINTCLQGLDATARAAFVLRYFHGESIGGVCKRLKMSESKAKSMLLRTRKKLREHLQREDLL
jgi:RNA polymerase sigma-70 factor (ECF subfamily)